MTGEKKCERCGKSKPICEFGILRGTADGYRSWCKECWKETNQGRVETQGRKRKARVIPEDFKQLMEEAIKEADFSTVKVYNLYLLKEQEFKDLGYKTTDVTKGIGKLYLKRNGYKYVGNYRWMKE